MVLVTSNWKLWGAGMGVSLVIFLIVFFTVIQPDNNAANSALKTGLQQSQQAIDQAKQQISNATSQAGSSSSQGSSAASQGSTVAAQAQTQLSKASKLTACVTAAGTDVSKITACQSQYAK